jgi:hypothetical protein
MMGEAYKQLIFGNQKISVKVFKALIDNEDNWKTHLS